MAEQPLQARCNHACHTHSEMVCRHLACVERSPLTSHCCSSVNIPWAFLSFHDVGDPAGRPTQTAPSSLIFIDFLLLATAASSAEVVGPTRRGAPFSYHHSGRQSIRCTTFGRVCGGVSRRTWTTSQSRTIGLRASLSILQIASSEGH